jgi:hypothetical protein
MEVRGKQARTPHAGRPLSCCQWRDGECWRAVCALRFLDNALKVWDLHGERPPANFTCDGGPIFHDLRQDLIQHRHDLSRSHCTTRSPLADKRFAKGIIHPISIDLPKIHSLAGALQGPPKFSFVLHPFWSMLSHETAQKLCVFRHDPSLCVLPPNKPLPPTSPGTPFAIFFRSSYLPGKRSHPLRSATQFRRISTSPFQSIEFA